MSGPGDTLASKLARLAELETRFAEAVETEKLEALAEFAAGAGHEINNPLTVISGRAELLLQEESDLERRRTLALISAQAMRVHEMIADMRLFARPPRPEPEVFDLSALLDQVIADMAPRAARQDTVISRVGEKGDRSNLPERPAGCSAQIGSVPFFPDNLPERPATNLGSVPGSAQIGPVPLFPAVEIEADPTQLSVAVRALCQNALEALESGGHITIGLNRNGRNVEIQVADDGPGITPEERRHLFDPFYSARQAGRGLGLGLSKCWRIVTNHGGRVEVESQPGHGACFTMVLPEKAL